MPILISLRQAIGICDMLFSGTPLLATRASRCRSTSTLRRIMKTMFILKYIILLLAVFSCVQPNPAGKKALKNEPQLGENTIRETVQMEPSRAQRRDYVPGQVLVKFKDGVDEQAIQTIKEAMSLKTIRVIRRPNLYLMRISDVTSVESIIERLMAFPEVSYAEPNYRVTVH